MVTFAFVVAVAFAFVVAVAFAFEVVVAFAFDMVLVDVVVALAGATFAFAVGAVVAVALLEVASFCVAQAVMEQRTSVMMVSFITRDSTK